MRLLGLAVILNLILAPLVGEAQQSAKIARVGWLGNNLATLPHVHEAFRQGLRDLGYVVGRDVVIEYRDAEGKLERFPALAAEFVAFKVDVIVTGNTPAALAAKQATRTIPVVMSMVMDPVGSGIVPSLARPGGSITGTSFMARDLAGKQTVGRG